MESAEELRSRIGGRLEDMFLKLGALSEDALLYQKSNFFGIPLLKDSELPDPLSVFEFMAAGSQPRLVFKQYDCLEVRRGVLSLQFSILLLEKH